MALGNFWDGVVKRELGLSVYVCYGLNIVFLYGHKYRLYRLIVGF